VAGGSLAGPRRRFIPESFLTSLRQPSLYIPHGGGPCFFMEPMPGLPPGYWDRMAAYLRGLVASLPAAPAAAIVVSAHWEAPRVTVGMAARHGLLYDYVGFPEHTYRLQYPARGAPELAQRVAQALESAGIAVDRDTERPIDHGVFIPFLLIDPAAGTPIVPLSLREGLDPAEHVVVGRALARFRDEGVLIVGSGMSYHNLRRLFRADAAADAAARAFDAWLAEAVAHAEPAARAAALARWREAPGALECHPRAEHLLPLMVAAGAGDTDPGWRPYVETMLGKPVCSVQFGAGPVADPG
jgi:aromatic ring-opening dioxygenase catalytic subunit (LigB family)